MQESNQFISKMEYQKSLNQNYLVYKNEWGEENYELRMLAENHIDHLLPIELRSIDGRDDIYYKVESFQPLSKLYKNREMKLEDVRIILIGLTGAIAAIQEYMLDERHVVLLPEYIFKRTESREVRLLFHPFYEGDIREGVRGFADYLIGRIDHTEQRAVMMGYQFYRIVREDNFIIEDIVNLYQREPKDSMDRCKEMIQGEDDEIDQEISKNEYAKTSLYTANNEITENNKNYQINKIKNRYNDEINDIKTKNIKNKDIKSKENNNKEIENKDLNISDHKKETNLKKLFVFSVLALMSGIFLCFDIGHYRPDHMAKVILAFILLISVLGVIREIIRHFRNRKEHDLEENRYDSIFSDYENKLHSDTEDWAKQNNFEIDLMKKNKNEDDNSQEEPEIYGRTVLLTADGKIAENILMEKRRGKEIVHHLDEFPYVIGKIKDSVDLVLNDISVSRIHAKLTEENGQVYVQDCNSTNGTYVNGVLLEKEEKIPIEADDEIRIGRIILLYQ